MCPGQASVNSITYALRRRYRAVHDRATNSTKGDRMQSGKLAELGQRGGLRLALLSCWGIEGVTYDTMEAVDGMIAALEEGEE